MVQLTDEEAARRQLETILDATEQERGEEIALRAAATLRTALTQGTINGSQYRELEGPGRCAIGYLAQGVDPGDPRAYRDSLPGYDYYSLDMPLEAFVGYIRPGQTATDNDDLAAVASWLDIWTAAHR